MPSATLVVFGSDGFRVPRSIAGSRKLLEKNACTTGPVPATPTMLPLLLIARGLVDSSRPGIPEMAGIGAMRVHVVAPGNKANPQVSRPTGSKPAISPESLIAVA